MQPWQANFLQHNKLDSSYLHQAQRWFDPLLRTVSNSSATAATPFILGINGAQGSGKSTLADYFYHLLKARTGLSVAVLSLDDFYYSKRHRQQLGVRVHPLLATRGVPGTHDVSLALKTIDQLCTGSGRVQIPRFDKSRDDLCPQSQLKSTIAPVNIIILEGWCLGAKPQDAAALAHPINRLERELDTTGAWRQYVNRALAGLYQELFKRIDCWIMLRAPSFEQVFEWRLEQELKLVKSTLKQNQEKSSASMDSEEIATFILHFQRITDSLLRDLPNKVDHLFQLNAQRTIIGYQERPTNHQ